MTSTGRAFLTLFGLSLIVSYLLMLNELRIMLNWCVENYVTFKQRHINHIPLVIIGLWTIVRWITIHIIYDFLIPKALFINLIMRWSELAPVDTIVTDLISICVSMGGKRVAGGFYRQTLNFCIYLPTCVTGWPGWWCDNFFSVVFIFPSVLLEIIVDTTKCRDENNYYQQLV